MGIIGYVLLLTVSDNRVKYFATFLCSFAAFAGPCLNLTWINVNVAPHYRRATAIGIQQSIGGSAGIVAGQIYRKSPYKLGNSFSLGCLIVAQLVVLGHAWFIKLRTDEKVKIASGLIEDTRKVKDGDRAVDFKYHY